MTAGRLCSAPAQAQHGRWAVSRGCSGARAALEPAPLACPARATGVPSQVHRHLHKQLVQREMCSPTSRPVRHSQSILKEVGRGREVTRLCAHREGNGYLRNYSDFHWQLSTIYSSALGFPPLSSTFTVFRVMSLLYQDDKVHHSCAPGAQLSATAQSSSWCFMSNPWCVTASGCALH